MLARVRASGARQAVRLAFELADFTRARKGVEEVYRRWYDNAWLRSPDAEMQALRRWVASMVRAQRPEDIYRRLQRWAPASLLRGRQP